MFKKILFGILIVLGLILAYVLIKASSVADTYHVERSVSIAAPVDSIYPHISNYHKWEAWNPWQKQDPTTKNTYTGAESGKGAKMAWEGEKSGSGSMEILNAAPDRIDMDLHFIKPFEDHAKNGFIFASEGNATKLTWYMDGNNNFMSKIFVAVSGDFDAMIGKDFENGLAGIKGIVEKKN